MFRACRSLLQNTTIQLLHTASTSEIVPRPNSSRTFYRQVSFRLKEALKNGSPASSLVTSEVLTNKLKGNGGGGEGGRSGVIQWYLQRLKEAPVATKSITTSGIFTTADVISQSMVSVLQARTAAKEEKKLEVKFDPMRTFRMAAIGLVLAGPTLHLWFNLMAKLMPKTDIKSTVTKMALGQLLYGPTFNATFFSINAAAQGESRVEIGARLKRDLLPTMLNGLFYWPPCDFITFRYVPVHMQAPRNHYLGHVSSTRTPTRNPFSSPAPRYSAAHSLHTFAHRLPLLPSPSSPHSSAAFPTPFLAPSLSPSPIHSPFLQSRSYVQLRTVLEVADNSGAKRVQCIKVLKGAKRNAAAMGDIIIASVKDALPRGKVKKGEVVTCVVVRAAFPRRRADGGMIRFDGPAAVVVNKAGEPVGTRVFGPVPHELRRRKFVKILTLAQLVA